MNIYHHIEVEGIKYIHLERLWQTQMGWTGTCDNVFNHIWTFKCFTGTGINIINIYNSHNYSHSFKVNLDYTVLTF